MKWCTGGLIVKNRCLAKYSKKIKEWVQNITDIDEHDEEEEVDKRWDVKRLVFPRTKKRNFYWEVQ